MGDNFQYVRCHFQEHMHPCSFVDLRHLDSQHHKNGRNDIPLTVLWSTPSPLATYAATSTLTTAVLFSMVAITNAVQPSACAEMFVETRRKMRTAEDGRQQQQQQQQQLF